LIREGRGEKAEYNSLEKLVQKLEGEIRNHIRTEHQLRLYIESLETEEHIKNAQVENLNEKMNKLKRENDELKELLELHKRELSMARSRRFKKHPEKLGKGSLPQVKKALTNSQGSIVATAQPERIRQVPQEEQNRRRRQRFVDERRGRSRYGVGKEELNETDDTASLTMRKLKINNILDSDHKKDNSQLFNATGDKFSVVFRRMLDSYRKAKHSSKGSLSQAGVGNISASGRAQSGRLKPRQPLVNNKSKKKIPIFDRKEKVDVSKLQKTSTKKHSITSNSKVRKPKDPRPSQAQTAHII
jgi:hypothetical protein